MANLHGVPEGHHSTKQYRDAGQETPYQHQEYPKLVYKGKGHKQVASAEEEKAALEAGFSLTPPVAEPEPEAV